MSTGEAFCDNTYFKYLCIQTMTGFTTMTIDRHAQFVIMSLLMYLWKDQMIQEGVWKSLVWFWLIDET
jgi:hypothetical protein